MSFKPFGKGNPCPVCGLESSACRVHVNDSNYIHCHTHADARKFEIVGDWRCIEVAKGHTAGFRPYDSHLSEKAKREQKTRWLQEQQIREKKRKQKFIEQKAKALSIEQRHELYSQIRQELINSGLRFDFDLQKSRNLSETENQLVEVFKVGKYHQLSKKYDSRLPGLNKFNQSQLGNSGDGLIGFIRNVDGLISGYQVRLENAPDGGRYRWGSSGDTPVHTFEHGELPLAVYVPSELKSFDIQLVEGTIIKPQIAAERTGKITIGASGGSFLSSKETLEAYIQKIREVIWQVALENGLTSTQTKNQSQSPQSGSTKSTASKNQNKSKQQLKNVGARQSGSTNLESSSYSTSTFTTWLYHSLTNSLLKTLNLTDSASVTALSQNSNHVVSLSRTPSFIAIPDAGDIINQSVAKRWLQQFEFFSKLGYEIKISWWGQVDKSHQDIDELQPSDYANIRYLDIAEFKSLCFEWGGLVKSGTGFSKEQNNKQKSNDSNQSLSDDWKWNKWLKSRKFTPDKTVHQKEFTIDNIPKSGVIVAANSGLGTGKTNFLIYQIKESRKIGKGSVIIGYRNNLLIQTGERALDKKIPIYHIHQDEEARLLVPDESSNHMMCLDSIHHIDGYFKGRDIYLDETVSVLLHAVNGGTLGDSQAKALRIFKKGLQDCDRIFLLDGNLADLYVNFIAKLATNKRVIKVKNTQKIPSHNIQIIDGIDDEGEIKKRDRSPLIQFLLKPEVKSWVFCDSKERTKVLYKLLTDLGRKGYVLNSETTGEDWAKEFLADPDKFIAANNPDFMLLSPSGDSGLSSTIKNHFTHKFTFFSGVLGTNSQHQAMFRLRDDSIPHYVFCPEFSTVRNRSNPKNYSVNQIKDILNNRIVQSALLASDCSDNPQKAIEVIAEALNRNDSDWYGFSLQMTALDNYEMDNLRKCLIHVLEEAGHNVEIAEWDIVGKVKEAEKLAKEEIQLVHSKEIFEAVEFDSIEIANKKAKESPNKATQRRIEKTWLLERLPGIKNTTTWSTQFIHQCHVINRDFIKQQERYWLLKNYETSQKRHESIWNYAALGEDFFSRSVSAMGHDVIWALRELNLLSFTETKQLLNKNSPEVVQLVKTLRERPDLQLALRISRLEPETVDGKERLRILNNLLEIIGFKTRCTGRKIIKTEDGTIRLRHYHVIPNAVRNSRQNSTASTPPHIYIDSQGCGRNQIPSNNQGSSRLDLELARQAILEAIEYKFTKWMNSDKSKVKWEVEAEEKPITQSLIPNSPSPISHSEADIAAEKLRTVSDWDTSWATPEHWANPETIMGVVEILELCDTPDELAEVRLTTPADVLKVASRQLSQEKREQVRAWVLSS